METSAPKKRTRKPATADGGSRRGIKLAATDAPQHHWGLPVRPPFASIEALAALKVPEGPEWQYEPKWDGFRCIAFREGKHVELQSKTGQPLARYFPEVVAAMASLRAEQFVIDGEIVARVDGDLSFDDLLMRIHPAESRIRKLAQQTPAIYLAFDLLVDETGKLLTQRPLHERRRALENFARSFFGRNGTIRLSPATKQLAEARQWFNMGIGLDGIIAKDTAAVYESGARSGVVQKIKQHRTADCVVGGFRYASKGKVVGSLLLGLYDEEGLLNHVRFTSSMHADERSALTSKLQSLIKPPGFTGNAPGGPSRWSTERSAEWHPLETKLVVEVQYDHFSGGRFRHGTKLQRWRPDKSPRQCTISQVKRESRSPLDLL